MYLHDHSSEFKEAYDLVSEYFSGINQTISEHIPVACMIKTALSKKWSLKKLVDIGREEKEPPFWCKEYENLLDYLEKEYSIQFPPKKLIEEDESYKYYKIMNSNLNVETLCEIISHLRQEEKLPKKFFITISEEIQPMEIHVPKWSKGLQDTTRRCLENLEISSFFQGFCVLKNIKGGFGKLTLGDASSDKYYIRDMKSDTIILKCSNIDDLLEKGWVVD